MEYKTLFIVSLIVCIGLGATATFFYMDRSAQDELIATLTQERDDAIQNAASLEEEKGKLVGRLKLLESSNGSDSDIDRLKRSIDEKDAEISRLKQNLANAGNNNDNRRDGGRNWNRGGNRPNMQDMRQRGQDMMERLKQEDPERYERMVAERERRQQEMQNRIEKRNNYINGINLGKLNSTQRQAVEEYQALIKANDNIRANMQEDNTGESFRQMMQNQMAMGQLSGQIRDILIEQYVDSLKNGSGSQAAEEINSILEATGGMGGPGGFGGPRGFGGPGGRPPRGGMGGPGGPGF